MVRSHSGASSASMAKSPVIGRSRAMAMRNGDDEASTGRETLIRAPEPLPAVRSVATRRLEPARVAVTSPSSGEAPFWPLSPTLATRALSVPPSVGPEPWTVRSPLITPV